MHTFVINLEKDRARREAVRSQLERLNLSYEFFPGVLGSALSQGELAECYNDRKARWLLCKSLTPAEIGCAFSHLKVYKEIIERDLEYALVLEDDVTLPVDMHAVLGEIQRVKGTGRPQVILLSPAKSYKRRARVGILGGKYDVAAFKEGTFTSSYIVTKSAASALLKELYPIGDVADCWNRLNRYGVVNISVIEPPLIEQNREVYGSATSEDILKLLNKWSKWQWFLFKCCRVRSVFFDFFYALYRRVTGSLDRN